MGRIRSSRTRPEETLQAAFDRARVTYSRPKGRGKPDFVILGAKVAVFVDGCFWHGCPAHYRPPRNNAEYWAWKVRYNKGRDRATRRNLRADDWAVVRVWEHSLPKRADWYAAKVAGLVLDRIRLSASPLLLPGQVARRFLSGQGPG